MLKIDIENSKNRLKTLYELKMSRLPLYLWGAGNVADEVYQKLEQSGIVISGVFINKADNKKKFNGYNITSLEEILENNETVNVIIGHAQYHKKVEMEKIKGINKVYYILNPFRTHDDISYSYYEEHRKEFEDAYLLFEENSKKVYQAYLNTRINDNLNYLLECFDKPITYFDNRVFSLSEIEQYVDIGAYNGDTVIDFVKTTKGKYSHIYAFEPAPRLFQELQDNVNRNCYREIDLYQLGLWNSNEQLSFVSESGQSDRVVLDVDSVDKIKAVTLDSFLGDKQVTLIKSSLSVGTREWIEGAENILRKQKPRLIINVGLRRFLLYQIPCLLHEINNEYKFCLKFIESMPSRLFLFAY